MHHPFAEKIGLAVDSQAAGKSETSLTIEPEVHHNPHAVAHGAVLYALADTGMGAALYPLLQPGEMCATIEIKINYFKPVFSGTLRCTSEVVNRGKSVVHLESRIFSDGALVASAGGHYAVFRARQSSK